MDPQLASCHPLNLSGLGPGTSVCPAMACSRPFQDLLGPSAPNGRHQIVMFEVCAYSDDC